MITLSPAGVGGAWLLDALDAWMSASSDIAHTAHVAPTFTQWPPAS
jgi:hypothetical protein